MEQDIHSMMSIQLPLHLISVLICDWHNYCSGLQCSIFSIANCHHYLGCPNKVPGSCLHLHPLEGVAFSSSSICQDIPRPPVDTIGHPTVAPTVILPIQVSCQAGIKPPACTIVLTTISSCITVMISISRAEGTAIMVVTFAVAQSITCITRVLSCCQTIPGRQEKHMSEGCVEDPSLNVGIGESSGHTQP